MQNKKNPYASSLKLLAGAISIALLSGCAFKGSMNDKEMNKHLDASNYKAIASVYLKDGKPNYRETSLVELLKAGKAFNDAGMWRQSKRAFYLAHQKLAWKEDTVDTPSEVLNLIGTTLTSSKFGAYQGKIFEGGMLDYYQAINEIMLGDESNARVAFRRFDERMQNAVAQFASFRDDAYKQARANFGQDQTGGTAGNSYQQIRNQVGVGVAQAPSGLPDAKIRIAVGEFMSGVFRATSSVNRDKSRDRVVGPLSKAYTSVSSVGGGQLVSKTARQLQARNLRSKGKVYILYEDGRGPSFDEYRIDLPLFLVSNKVTYSGIALPTFVPGKPAFGSLVLDGSQTVEMTNVNNLAGMEFTVAYPGIVTKAVVSTVVKTALQIAANSKIDKETKDKPLLGALLKLGVGATQAAMTQADERAWTNLPNSIQAAVVDMPSSGKLTVATAGGFKIGDIDLPPADNVLVVIKASGTQGVPAAYVKALPTTNKPLMTASR